MEATYEQQWAPSRYRKHPQHLIQLKTPTKASQSSDSGKLQDIVPEVFVVVVLQARLEDTESYIGSSATISEQITEYSPTSPSLYPLHIEIWDDEPSNVSSQKMLCRPLCIGHVRPIVRSQITFGANDVIPALDTRIASIYTQCLEEVRAKFG